MHKCMLESLVLWVVLVRVGNTVVVCIWICGLWLRSGLGLGLGLGMGMAVVYLWI